jgi:hypothetical protein
MSDTTNPNSGWVATTRAIDQSQPTPSNVAWMEITLLGMGRGESQFRWKINPDKDLGAANSDTDPAAQAAAYTQLVQTLHREIDFAFRRLAGG